MYALRSYFDVFDLNADVYADEQDYFEFIFAIFFYAYEFNGDVTYSNNFY